MALWRFVLVGVVVCLFAGSAQAHESRPLYVDIGEIQKNVFDVRWRIPLSVGAGNAPEVKLAGCEAQFEYQSFKVRGGLARQEVVDCPDGVGEVSIVYPKAAPAMSALVHVRSLSGGMRSTLLAPGVLVWDVPEIQSGFALSWNYMVLGVEHIWIGVDHLLFLACLIIIAGSGVGAGRRVLITVTGFTLAHSVTLSLATLGVFQVPIAPVEAVIALSIVFLAVEIVRGRRESLTWRYPVAVSGSFGLLHGFGFASVLGEIGLPQGEILNGLLFFNVGVEIGQVLFIGVVMALIAGLSRLRFDVSRALVERRVAYVVGALASFWVVERVVAFWG